MKQNQKSFFNALIDRRSTYLILPGSIYIPETMNVRHPHFIFLILDFEQHKITYFDPHGRSKDEQSIFNFLTKSVENIQRSPLNFKLQGQHGDCTSLSLYIIYQLLLEISNPNPNSNILKKVSAKLKSQKNNIYKKDSEYKTFLRKLKLLNNYSLFAKLPLISKIPFNETIRFKLMTARKNIRSNKVKHILKIIKKKIILNLTICNNKVRSKRKQMNERKRRPYFIVPQMAKSSDFITNTHTLMSPGTEDVTSMQL